jgi:hypothetical protein
MATDRNIHWTAPSGLNTGEQWARLPARSDLGRLCRDYTRGLAVSVRWHRDRYIVTLPGESRSALHRIAGKRNYERGRRRCVEVWAGVVGDRYVVDVMTRSADEITSAVAEGLAALVARQWGGTREC